MNDIKREWPHIPDDNIKELIAADEQFLRYHRFLLRELRSHGSSDRYPKSTLDFSLRASMVRTEIFFLGGIAEAALRAHAISSQIPGLKDKGTFGTLLKLWRRHGLNHINTIMPNLEQLCNSRNTIHLYVALEQSQESGNAFWRTVSAKEAETAQLGNEVLRFLKAFHNPGNLRGCAASS